MKFAYLILAHGSFELLKELLKAIDAPENDIYVHLDRKAGDIDVAPFMDVVKYSKLVFIRKRVNVKWGKISVVEATMNLFEEAAIGEYDYLHLLSGVDFPIKSNGYIQQFFLEHQGKEFVGFSKVHTPEEMKRRLVWYPFTRRDHSGVLIILDWVNYKIAKLQIKWNWYRVSPLDHIKTGSQWCSITRQLAVDIVGQRKQMIKRFKHIFAADETFIQTYLYENHLMDRVYHVDNEFESCCRYIDWNRGRPYVWQDEDFEELVNSPYLWARKFSEENMNLIRRIADYIKK